MDGGESPLDVLSRAATMLQENQQAVSATEDSTKGSTKQLPTTKWKRDRRTRSEYSRKSDPKIPEGFNLDQPSNAEVQTYNSTNNQQFVNGGSLNQGISNNSSQFSNGINGQVSPGSPGADTPLDMSVRQRGQPPSYTQTINNPGYRSSYRPSVITQAPNRDDVPSGISMCDPIIDEHFRRSLGKDYIKIFSNNNVPAKEPNPVAKAAPKVNGNVMELMDGAGLSVDDHFAKALGDTWLKLNKKENEIENQSTDKEAVMSV